VRTDPIKVQAVITISIDASDALVVEAHRRELTDLLAQLEQRHGAARLDIKSRRPRLAPRASPPMQLGAEFEIVRARYAG
jgi:hypothetical protein